MHFTKLAGSAVAAALAVTACQNTELPVAQNGGAVFQVLPPSPAPNGTANIEEFELCKRGSSASFSFSVVAYGGPGKTIPGAAQPGTVALTAGECRVIAVYGGFGADVTVTETAAQSGFHLDHVDVSVITGSGTTTTTVAGPSVTEFISGGSAGRGALAVYFNVADASGQGCTPGYWKQSQHFDSWPAGYLPDQLFSAHFDDAFPGKSLLQVLGQGGGGLTALGRHTVAALLNAASSGVNYGLTAQQVKDAFNAAFPGGDYEGLKDHFATLNERGCPLN